ncbi:MAG TPA: diguanylate cyclase [Polyangia bacterium]|nr:diguanylate cyclase [Polyangia bacterium]
MGLGDSIERLIEVAADGTTGDLLLEATTDITRLLGQRGSCILLEDGPRVAIAPHDPSAIDLRLDLARYPEVVAAIEGREVVTIDDVQRDARLDRVRHLLPAELGAVSAVPLTRAGNCLGAFLVQSGRHHPGVTAEARVTAGLLAKFTALILSERRQGQPEVLSAVASLHPVAVAVAVAAGVGPESLLNGDVDVFATAPRILVVEDDPALKMTLAESLQEEGFVVATAATAEEGLVHAAAVPPALILLDVRLPLIDGFQMARRLREMEGLRGVPILFLSGASDLPVRVRAAQMDDVDFLRKPFARDELFTRIHRVIQQAAARDKLRAEAQHDELTGLGNRRSLRASLAAERARFDRYGEPFSVVVFDLDKLKNINDQHGHQAGDMALRAVADVLRREGRETDLAVRYGGDEFVVLLPHTTGDEAMVFAARTLGHVARLNPGGIAVKVSAGVASLDSLNAGESADAIIGRADAAAYRAKRAGGDRVFRDGQQ